MKKRLYISSAIIIIVLALLVSANFLLSFHKITFSLANDVTSATIYRSNKQKIKDITTKDTTAFLKNGSYYLIPKGTNISQDAINFSVKKGSKTIAVNPSYSKEYLADLLKKEEAPIETALTTKYPSVLAEYTLKQGNLYQHGDWFGGLLAPVVDDARDQKDPYRVVLHKQNGTWQVVRRPEYILTSAQYTNVPIGILRAINLLVE